MNLLDLTAEDLASHIALLEYVREEAVYHATVNANKNLQTLAERVVLRRCLEIQGMCDDEIRRQEAMETTE